MISLIACSCWASEYQVVYGAACHRYAIFWCDARWLEGSMSWGCVEKTLGASREFQRIFTGIFNVLYTPPKINMEPGNNGFQ